MTIATASLFWDDSFSARFSPTSVECFDGYHNDVPSTYWDNDFELFVDDNNTFHNEKIPAERTTVKEDISSLPSPLDMEISSKQWDHAINKYTLTDVNIDDYLNEKYMEYLNACGSTKASMTGTPQNPCKDSAASVEMIDMEDTDEDLAPLDLARSTSDDLLKLKPLLSFGHNQTAREAFHQRPDEEYCPLSPIAMPPHSLLEPVQPCTKLFWNEIPQEQIMLPLHEDQRRRTTPLASIDTNSFAMMSLVREPIAEWEPAPMPQIQGHQPYTNSIYRPSMPMIPPIPQRKVSKRVTFAPDPATSSKGSVPSVTNSENQETFEGFSSPCSFPKLPKASKSARRGSIGQKIDTKTPKRKSSSVKISKKALSANTATKSKVSITAQTDEQERVAETGEETTKKSKKSPKFRKYQAENWSFRFKEVCDFVQRHGHCNIPHDYPRNQPLARWAKRQRYQYKLYLGGEKSSMTAERMQALENLGFCWDAHKSIWSGRFQELQEFFREHGHANVPSKYPKSLRLATWVKCQRRQYKLWQAGERANITQERINLLESIGFQWVLDNNRCN